MHPYLQLTLAERSETYLDDLLAQVSDRKPTDRLETGDHVYTPDGSYVQVESIDWLAGSVTVRFISDPTDDQLVAYGLDELLPEEVVRIAHFSFDCPSCGLDWHPQCDDGTIVDPWAEQDEESYR